MKKNPIFFALLVAFCLISCSKINKEENETQEDIFNKPTDQTRLHTWWHWVQGAISKEGITADLEMMKTQGIVQATILNVGLVKEQEFGVKRIVFGTEEWYDMFGWAVEEAKRLGISIGVHNCDGWSSSGGPWITPEQSMKTFTWSKTIMEGGKNRAVQLTKPFFRANFYKDVAVVAFQTKAVPTLFQQANPVFKLNDTLINRAISDGSISGGPVLKYGDKITIEMPKPFTAGKIAIMGQKAFTWANPKTVKSSYFLYSSMDGKNYRKVADMELGGYNEYFQIKIPVTTAKFFKLEFKEFPWGDSWFAYSVPEIELLAADEQPTYSSAIPFFDQKIGMVKASDLSNFGQMASVEHKVNKVIDLTDKMQPDGTLDWDAPAGNWNIIRFGYTTTDVKNSPATKEGEGLECDKMDSNAVAFHFSQFSQKLVDKAGSNAGNTFKFMLIDSWECAFQNWTESLPNEFEKQRGYKLTDFIPALCGEIVEDAATSEAFLYDYRKTIAELIENNYYKKFNKLCHNNKLEMHAEVIYGGNGYPPLDVLRANDYADLPMFEFWGAHNGNTGLIEYTPQTRVNLDFPASAALFYDKKVFGAEAYTGMAHYSETPFEIKPFGDRAYCSGINQFILHSNVHQPQTTTAGITLGPYGSHFNRNNPWFSFIGSWADYHARVQYLLQKGQMQADILYYVGDQLPQNNELNTKKTPVGYQAHIANFDILQNKLKVKDGKLVFGGVKFSLLLLPDNMGMELATLERIAELVNEGAMIYGSKPTKPLSMNGLKKERQKFDDLIIKLWGQNESPANEIACGKGKIFSGETVEKVLSKIGLKPDFETGLKDSLSFLYTHRVLSDQDIYFVFNQTNQSISTDLLFRAQNGKTREFDPKTGAVKMLNSTKTEDGRMKINYTFAERESKFFVFEKGEIENKALETKSEIIEITDLKAKINFHAGYATISPIETLKLKSLSEFELSEHKYFSGTANYEVAFSAPQSYVAQKTAVYIDFGVVGGTASITLNGVNLGTVWSPNSKFEVSGLLKETNTLNMAVGNEFRNRIIGDLIEHGALKNIWTTSPIKDFLNKDKSLKPSGFVGPLKLVKTI